MTGPGRVLSLLSGRPPLYEPGDACFWTDPYISGQLLAMHLNPDSDVASRNKEAIDRTIASWLENGWISPGDLVLDLGCGPGLYAERLARAGARVVGIDQSERSVSYARGRAEEEGLRIEYRLGDFLQLSEEEKYDKAIQVYGEYCALSDKDRRLFLANIYRALKPGGLLLMDVTTRRLRMKAGLRNRWYTGEAGFWRLGRHLVLEEGIDYPEDDVWLDQYVVLDEDGRTTLYRVWFKDFTKGTLKSEVEAAGFKVVSVRGGLAGEPYDEEGDWIAVALRKE